jgi:hypothetical protein
LKGTYAEVEAHEVTCRFKPLDGTNSSSQVSKRNTPGRWCVGLQWLAQLCQGVDAPNPTPVVAAPSIEGRTIALTSAAMMNLRNEQMPGIYHMFAGLQHSLLIMAGSDSDGKLSVSTRAVQTTATSPVDSNWLICNTASSLRGVQLVSCRRFEAVVQRWSAL